MLFRSAFGFVKYKVSFAKFVFRLVWLRFQPKTSAKPMFFELPGVKTSCVTCPKPILSREPLSPGFAGGRGVEPGGGDLGEFTCGKRWASDVVCVSNNGHIQFASLHGLL